MQFLVEPFHRMFSLDNLAIQYPHAEKERVSVCTYPLPDRHVKIEDRKKTNQALMCVVFCSLAVRLRGGHSLTSPHHLGERPETGRSSGPCYLSGTIDQVCSSPSSSVDCLSLTADVWQSAIDVLLDQCSFHPSL